MRFYGRQAELDQLRSHLVPVEKGASSLAVIRGSAGTGKTALATQFFRTLGSEWLRCRGRSQKEDSEGPYRALREVLENLAHSVLTSKEELFNRIQLELQQNLGPHSSLLIAIAPDLQRLLKIEDAAQTLPAVGKDQVKTAVARMVSLIARHRAVVLFLDDLHWASADTLAVALHLAKSRLKGVALILAYRPALRLDKEWAGLEPCLIELAGLPRHDVQVLVDDQELGALAEELFSRTGGNPFFLHSVLRRLKQSGERKLDSLPMENELAQFLLEELGTLPPATSTALFQAACHGGSFSLSLLAEFRQEKDDQTLVVLNPALEAGFLRQGSSADEFEFAHDAFFEAVMNDNDQTTRAKNHLHWARLLRQKNGIDAIVLAEQYLRGSSQLKSDRERELFARLASEGGSAATEVSAFEQGLDLFQGGLLALQPIRDSQADLYRKLCLQGARAAMALGKTDLVHRFAQDGAGDAEEPLQELERLHLRVEAWIHGGEGDRAIQQAEAFLERHGTRPLTQRSPLAALKEWIAVLLLIGRKKPDELRRLRFQSDPFLVGLHDLEMLLTPLYARRYPKQLPLHLLTFCRKFLTEGAVPTGSSTWVGYAVLCTYMGRPELGVEFARMAVAQAEQWDKKEWCFCRFHANFSVFPWTCTLSQAIDGMREVQHSAMEWGHSTVAFMARTTADAYDYFQGTELPILAERVKETRQIVTTYNHQDAFFFCDIVGWAIARLTGNPEVKATATDDIEQLRAELMKLHVSLVLGELDKVAKLAVEIPESITAPFLGVFQFVHWTYLGVAASLLAEEGRLGVRTAAATIRRARKNLKRWCRHVPERCWRLHWVEAAEKKWRGDPRALEIYDKAIAQATKQGFVQDAALMAEQAGKFCMVRSSERLGRAYLAEASGLYERWGASRKVREIQALQGAFSTDPLSRARRVVAELQTPREQLHGLVQLCIECTGARRGLLFEESEERPIVGDAAPGYPAEVVRFVRRTAEDVFLPDPAASRFSADPYIFSRREAGSLLCLPVVSGRLLLGTLLLEAVEVLEASIETAKVLCTSLAGVMKADKTGRLLEEERRMREQGQLRNVELEARRKAMTAFLGIAAHDLKAPLGSIKLWLEQYDADKAGAREQIGTACLRAERLIGSYLDAVAVEYGCEMGLQRELCSVDTLIEQELELILSQLAEDKRERTHLAWELEPMSLPVDQERFRQVISNLVENALACCSEGTPIDVSLTLHDSTACLTVADQGPGVPEHLRGDLFEPFECGGQGMGRGLGLWICRLIVEAHGGTLFLEPAAKGACFRVLLPVDASGGPVGQRRLDLFLE